MKFQNLKHFNLPDQKLLQEQTDEINRMIEFLLSDIKSLRKNRMLYAGSLYDKILKLQNSMNEFHLIDGDKKQIKIIDLDSYIENKTQGFVNNGLALYFAKEDQKEQLVSLLKDISENLSGYSNSIKCCGFMCNKIKFATPDQMRWSLK